MAVSTNKSGKEGHKGEQGDPGSPGTPGSVWRNGNGAPSNGLGIDGDYYLDDATGNVYWKQSGSYSIVANIEGPQGPVGPEGPPGSAGYDLVSFTQYGGIY